MINKKLPFTAYQLETTNLSNNSFDKIYLNFIKNFENLLNTEDNTYKNILLNELYELLNATDVTSFKEKIKDIEKLTNDNILLTLQNLSDKNVQEIKTAILKSTFIEAIRSLKPTNSTKKTIEDTINKNILNINKLLNNEFILHTRCIFKNIEKANNNINIASAKLHKINDKNVVFFNKSIKTTKTTINNNLKQIDEVNDKIEKLKDNSKYVFSFSKKNPFKTFTSIYKLSAFLGFTAFNGITLGAKFTKSLAGNLLKGTKYAVSFLGKTLITTISISFSVAFKALSMSGKFLSGIIKWCFSKPGIYVTSFLGGYMYGRFKNEITEGINSILDDIKKNGFDSILGNINDKIYEIFGNTIASEEDSLQNLGTLITGSYASLITSNSKLLETVLASSEPIVLRSTAALAESAAVHSISTKGMEFINYSSLTPTSGIATLFGYNAAHDQAANTAHKLVKGYHKLVKTASDKEIELESQNKSLVMLTAGRPNAAEKTDSVKHKYLNIMTSHSSASMYFSANVVEFEKYIEYKNVGASVVLSSQNLIEILQLYYLEFGDTIIPIAYSNNQYLSDACKKLRTTPEDCYMYATQMAIESSTNYDRTTIITGLRAQTANIHKDNDKNSKDITSRRVFAEEMVIYFTITSKYCRYINDIRADNAESIVYSIINDPTLLAIQKELTTFKKNSAVRIYARILDESSTEDELTGSGKVDIPELTRLVLANPEEEIHKVATKAGYITDGREHTKMFMKQYIPFLSSSIGESFYAPVIRDNLSLNTTHNYHEDNEKIYNILNQLIYKASYVSSYLQDDIVFYRNNIFNFLNTPYNMRQIDHKRSYEIAKYIRIIIINIWSYVNKLNEYIKLLNSDITSFGNTYKEQNKINLDKYIIDFNNSYNGFLTKDKSVEELWNTYIYNVHISSIETNITTILNVVSKLLNTAATTFIDICKTYIETHIQQHKSLNYNVNDVCNYLTEKIVKPFDTYTVNVLNISETTLVNFSKLYNITALGTNATRRMQDGHNEDINKHVNYIITQLRTKLGVNMILGSYLSNQQSQATLDVYLNGDYIHMLMAKYNRSMNKKTDLNVAVPPRDYIHTAGKFTQDVFVRLYESHITTSYSNKSRNNINTILNNICNDLSKTLEDIEKALPNYSDALNNTLVKKINFYIGYNSKEVGKSYDTASKKAVVTNADPDKLPPIITQQITKTSKILIAYKLGFSASNNKLVIYTDNANNNIEVFKKQQAYTDQYIQYVFFNVFNTDLEIMFLDNNLFIELLNDTKTIKLTKTKSITTSSPEYGLLKCMLVYLLFSHDIKDTVDSKRNFLKWNRIGAAGAEEFEARDSLLTSMFIAEAANPYNVKRIKNLVLDSFNDTSTKINYNPTQVITAMSNDNSLNHILFNRLSDIYVENGYKNIQDDDMRSSKYVQDINENGYIIHAPSLFHRFSNAIYDKNTTPGLLHALFLRLMTDNIISPKNPNSDNTTRYNNMINNILNNMPITGLIELLGKSTNKNGKELGQSLLAAHSLLKFFTGMKNSITDSTNIGRSIALYFHNYVAANPIASKLLTLAAPSVLSTMLNNTDNSLASITNGLFRALYASNETNSSSKSILEQIKANSNYNDSVYGKFIDSTEPDKDLPNLIEKICTDLKQAITKQLSTICSTNEITLHTYDKLNKTHIGTLTLNSNIEIPTYNVFDKLLSVINSMQDYENLRPETLLSLYLPEYTFNKISNDSKKHYALGINEATASELYYASVIQDTSVTKDSLEQTLANGKDKFLEKTNSFSDIPIYYTDENGNIAEKNIHQSSHGDQTLLMLLDNLGISVINQEYDE